MGQKRYLLVDGIRGLAIVNMVAFHFLYDVYMVYGKDPSWYSRCPVHIWQQAICWTFILIAGFVWRLGQKSNLRRGIFLNVCGLVISLVTWAAVPSEAVWFGILNFIGTAVLLMIPCHRLMGRISPGAGMIVSFAAFLLFRNVQRGYLGVGGIFRLNLPEWLYRCKVLTPFGFPFPEFASSDYFPLLPWFFLFLTGYFFYAVFEQRERWKKAARVGIPALSAIGQKSIWIYLIHQPVGMLLCSLWFS